MLFWLRCRIAETWSSLSSAGARVLSLSLTRPLQLLAEVARCRRACPCTASRRFCSSPSSELPSLMSVANSVLRSARVPVTSSVAFSSSSSSASRYEIVRDRSVSPSTICRTDSGVSLNAVGQRVEALLELVGVDLPNVVGQVRERGVDVVRRGGAARSGSRPSSEPRAERVDGDELLAEHRLDLDRRGRLVVQLDALGPEAHHDDRRRRAATLGDLADPDAGDPDLVAGLQAAGLGEDGLVLLAGAEDRQRVMFIVP